MAFSDWNEKKKLLVSVGVVAGLAVIFGGVAAFLMNERNNIKADMATRIAQGKKYQVTINKEAKLRKELEEKGAEAETAKANAPDQPQVAELLASLSKEASSISLQLLSTKVIPEKRVTGKRAKSSKSKFKDVKIELECRGSFDAFGKFISSIESRRFARYIEVNGFEITAHREGLVPDVDLTDFSMELIAKYYPPKVSKKKKK